MIAKLNVLAQAGALTALLALPAPVKRSLAGPPVVHDGQTLDVEAQLMLRLKAATRVKGVEDVPLERGRALLLEQALAVAGRQPIGQVADVKLGPIAGRRYLPRALVDSDAPLPTLVFIHGGAFAYGDLDSHDGVCRFLAERAGVQVIAVDYRLAPEEPFPAAYDDAVAAYSWVVENAAEFHVDLTRLAVGGDSAGGNLAAAVALAAARTGLPMAFQLLVYPKTDQRDDGPDSWTESRRLFGEGFYLTNAFMDIAAESYLPRIADRSDPRASPLLDEVPSGLAPAYVVTAGFDPLRDEGEAYARKLADAGVAVELKRHTGLIHGFLNMVGVGTSARAAVAEAAVKLRAGLVG